MGRTLAFVVRTLTAVVLAVSGAYMLVYLYRWEWNRAIISGLFFVAAEVAMATSMIIRRIRALEPGPSVRPPDPSVLERLRSTQVDRPNPFRWLAPRADRTAVFVPVLLGAGVILSALAYVVERVAEATALPVVDRNLARRLSELAPPRSGLTGRPRTAPSPPRRARPFPTVSTVATTVAIGGLAVLGALGLDALVDATQTRPDAAARPASTTIALEIVERHPSSGSAVPPAEALWVGCRPSLGQGLPTEGEVVPRQGNQVDLVLRPGIGHLATRRLTGCLSDLQVDLVRARVLDVDDAPSTAG